MSHVPLLSSSACGPSPSGAGPCGGPRADGWAAGNPEGYFAHGSDSPGSRDATFVSSYAPTAPPVRARAGLSADHVPDPLLSHSGGDDRFARRKETP
jgi:hypothetical protein